jgi:hypothetical protein
LNAETLEGVREAGNGNAMVIRLTSPWDGDGDPGRLRSRSW